MRTLLLAITIGIASAGQTSAQGLQPDGTAEEQIRQLEQRDAQAVMAGDFATMENTWADEFTVNSPCNRITRGKADVLKLIRAGNIGDVSPKNAGSQN